MGKHKQRVTYLAGPIGIIPQKGAAEWRIAIGKELNGIGIKFSNPMGNESKLDRPQLLEWAKAGRANHLRKILRSKIIGCDLRMVAQCDFVTLYIPEDNGYEICGSYGEMTLAHYLHKPVYIVTDRKLLPIEIPLWAVACSDWIFRTWEEYLKYVKEHYGK
jgi:hypothetical protein